MYIISVFIKHDQTLSCIHPLGTGDCSQGTNPQSFLAHSQVVDRECPLYGDCQAIVKNASRCDMVFAAGSQNTDYNTGSHSSTKVIIQQKS